MSKNALRILGIHPLAALAFIAIDMMLFAPDVTVIGWTISLSVGLALVVPCAILQHYVCKDSWLLSIAKGLILGILTAIPTPLPAFITGGSGICGYLNRNEKLKEPKEKTPPELKSGD
jgi:hypothetical protein